MVPHDLPASTIPMPAGERRSMVLFSGPSLRHLRLGYLLQREFPGLLQRWWMTSPSKPAQKLAKGYQRFASHDDVRAARQLLEEADFRRLARLAGRHLRWSKLARLRRRLAMPAILSNLGTTEKEMFAAEVEALRESAPLHPVEVDTPNQAALIEEVIALSPYFLVAFGGPLLSGGLLRSVRGFAINQHAGWSPELKGAATTEAALYHRNLNRVGNTIHLMDSFADAGPILRRSTATLHPDDDVAHCFLSVVALGNKMMLEVLGEALSAEMLNVFDQPAGGQTILGMDFVGFRRAAVARDFAHGWLADALFDRQEY